MDSLIAATVAALIDVAALMLMSLAVLVVAVLVHSLGPRAAAGGGRR